MDSQEGKTVMTFVVGLIIMLIMCVLGGFLMMMADKRVKHLQMAAERRKIDAGRRQHAVIPES